MGARARATGSAVGRADQERAPSSFAATRLGDTGIVSSTTSTTPTTSIDAPSVHRALRQQITAVVAVDDAVLEPLLITLLAGGHALVEGAPGIGKTLLSRTLAQSVDCTFHRIQFTNDLMPSDIVGSTVWKPKAEKFVFVRGPLFANLVLADEINRTSPRTLSCLLEAMESGLVSIEGRTVALGEPFCVLATRNPIEFHGTYPVPEAALDRFLVRVELDYPSPQREVELYTGADPTERLAALAPVVTKAELLEIRAAIGEVAVGEPVANYCYRVVTATRQRDDVVLGASPRAAMAWLRAARARAFLEGRMHVLPDDLKALARPVLAHRVFTSGGGSAAELIEELLERTPVAL
jgi:MoxR-like ATPase